jgi:hypothetical protein
MIGTYLLTVGLIFSLALAGIGVDRAYRRFAARHPQLGPFRDTSKCGCCSGHGSCDETSCDDEGAKPKTMTHR